MDEKKSMDFEDALDKTGFGLYSYLLTTVVGLISISFVCISYGTTIIIPLCACELDTTISQRGFLAAGPVVGLIIGCPLWGYLTDVYGRRSMLLISLLTAAAVNALASISVNWVMLLCLQFIASLLASGQYSQCLTLLSESVPAANRSLVVLLASCFVLLAQGIMAVLAIPIIPLTFSIPLPSLGIFWNSWRTLLLLYSAPSIISAAWLTLMQESPKFVYSRGRVDEAVEIMRKIHKCNYFGTSETFEVRKITKETADETSSRLTGKQQFMPLFRAPLLKYTVIITLLYVFQQVSSFLVWFPTITNRIVEVLETGKGTDLSVCGVINASLNTPPDPDAEPCSLNVTSMLIVFGAGLARSIVNLIMSLLINRVGSRNMVIIMSSFCGVCGIVTNLVPNVFASGALFTIFLFGIVLLGLYTTIAVTLFPTHLRSFAVAFSMTGGRIATFVSVQILNQLLESNCNAGFYLFSTIFASSAILAAFLVDDRKITRKIQ